jgi:hypothetical protein
MMSSMDCRRPAMSKAAFSVSETTPLELAAHHVVEARHTAQLVGHLLGGGDAPWHCAQGVLLGLGPGRIPNRDTPRPRPDAGRRNSDHHDREGSQGIAPVGSAIASAGSSAVVEPVMKSTAT